MSRPTQSVEGALPPDLARIVDRYQIRPQQDGEYTIAEMALAWNIKRSAVERIMQAEIAAGRWAARDGVTGTGRRGNLYREVASEKPVSAAKDGQAIRKRPAADRVSVAGRQAQRSRR